MKKLPFYPFMFAMFPLAYLFSENPNYTNLWEMPRSFAVVLGLTAMMWLVSAAVLRNWHKGAVLSIVGLAMLFTYGQMIDALHKIHLGLHIILAPIDAVILLVVLMIIWRSKRNFAKANHALNILSLCMVIVSLSTTTTRYDWSVQPNTSS